MSWKTTSRAALIIATLTLVAGFGLAEDSPLSIQMDGPFVLSGQVFEAGRLEASPVAEGNLRPLLLDGKAVALVFRHAFDRVPSNARDVGFLFRPDAIGQPHLVGLRWRDGESGRIEERTFRFASVARGPGGAAVAAGRR